MLKVFSHDIRHLTEQSKTPEPGDHEALKDHLKLELANLGLRHILSLYQSLVTGKNIQESPQTIALAQIEKDKTKPNWFSSGQLIVEVRMSVLPIIRFLWESDMVEKAGIQIPNRVIEIIRTIAEADFETGALKRKYTFIKTLPKRRIADILRNIETDTFADTRNATGTDKISAETKVVRQVWKPNDNLGKLITAGFDDTLAKEALYRTNGSHSHASEYCRSQNSSHSGGRNPIPLIDLDTENEANGTTRTGPSSGVATPVATDSEAPTLPTPVHIDLAAPQIAWGSEAATDDLIGTLPNEPVTSISSTNPPSTGTEAPPPSPKLITITKESGITTVDDLNEERAAIRKDLIDRCLYVINAHGEVTFEVSDLISVVVGKSEDPTTMRKEMGETLVQALLSFAAEEDVHVVGKQVAAYAHLLALMLQDKEFYKASVSELKDNLETLLDFVKLSPTHSSEESSPWIAHILLIIETLLSEDAQPRETVWTYPSMEKKITDPPILKTTELIVSDEHRVVLFGYILDILPRVGKDEPLALALLRILVILTRSRDIASSMVQKKNIGRLCTLAKQMGSANSARLQSSLMLILRHIVEDDEVTTQTFQAIATL
jgi:E3 ubiquitin-protein ligase HUWE1